MCLPATKIAPSLEIAGTLVSGDRRLHHSSHSSACGKLADTKLSQAISHIRPPFWPGNSTRLAGETIPARVKQPENQAAPLTQRKTLKSVAFDSVAPSHCWDGAI